MRYALARSAPVSIQIIPLTASVGVIISRSPVAGGERVLYWLTSLVDRILLSLPTEKCGQASGLLLILISRGVVGVARNFFFFLGGGGKFFGEV